MSSRNKPLMISPPGVTDYELLFCDAKHPNNRYMVNHYLQVFDEWLDTEPFCNPTSELPEDPVLRLVYIMLLEQIDLDDDNNVITFRYHDYNSNIYVLCNHSLVCRLKMIGYEFDEDLYLEEEIEIEST